MAAPGAAYRRLAEAPPAPGAWVLLRRPLLLAALIGAVVCLGTTGSLPPRLWPGASLCWSIVPGFQLALGAALVRLGGRGPLRTSSALDLLFVSHAPWSLWILGATAWAAPELPIGSYAWPSAFPLLVTAVVPLAWTAVLTFAYCRAVLGLSAPGAAFAVLLYELAVWSAAVAYVSLVTARGPLAGVL
jgi:hypothetical protein